MALIACGKKENVGKLYPIELSSATGTFTIPNSAGKSVVISFQNSAPSTYAITVNVTNASTTIINFITDGGQTWGWYYGVAGNDDLTLNVSVNSSGMTSSSNWFYTFVET